MAPCRRHSGSTNAGEMKNIHEFVLAVAVEVSEADAINYAVLEPPIGGKARAQILRSGCQVLSRQDRYHPGCGRKAEFLREIPRTALSGTAHVPKDNELLPLGDQLLGQGNDHVLRGGLVSALHDLMRRQERFRLRRSVHVDELEDPRRSSTPSINGTGRSREVRRGKSSQLSKLLRLPITADKTTSWGSIPRCRARSSKAKMSSTVMPRVGSVMN